MFKRVKGENFDCNELKYKQPRTNAHGGKSVYITFQNNERVVVQTPIMYLPFGVSKFEAGDVIKYSLDLSFQNLDLEDESSPMTKFYQNLDRLDNKLIDDGVTNSFLWHRKRGLTRDTIDAAMYTRQIKYSMDKEGEVDSRYPPRIKVKMYTNSSDPSKFSCEVYDGNSESGKEPLELTAENVEEVLTSGCRAQLLIQLTGMWFASGKYGITWKAMQMKLFRPTTLNQYAFIEDSDDDADEPEPNMDALTFVEDEEKKED